jgi:hypothetical protein
VLPDTAQSFRGTLYIHVWIRFLNWKKKKKKKKKKNANFYDTKWDVPTIMLSRRPCFYSFSRTVSVI